MTQRTIARTIDLDDGMFQEAIPEPLAMEDAKAHTFSLTILKNKEPHDLSAHTCVAYFIRPNRDTLIITGNADGNVATIELPAACYAYIGPFQILIRLISGDVKTSVYWARGHVLRSRTDPVVDPGDTVPKLDDIIAIVERCERAAEDARSAAESIGTLDATSVGAVAYASQQTLSDTEKAQARANIGLGNIEDLVDGVVKYSEAQQLTDAQKVQARTNIAAAGNTDISELVSGVTIGDGLVTVTKRDGTTASFEIPRGLTFDGGYCETDPADGKTYLYLTMNGTEITDYTPIEIPAGGSSEGLTFDGGFCAVDEADGNTYLHLTKDDVELSDDVYTPILIPAGSGGGGGSAITLTNVVKPSAIRDGADAVFSFTATSTDDTDITVHWFVNNDEISKSTGNSGDTYSFNAKGHLNDSEQNRVRAVITSEGGGSLERTWTVTSTAFSIAWGSSISPIMLYTTNEDVYAVIRVTAQARATNIVTVSVGTHTVDREVTGSRSLTVALDKSWFTIGTNRVTAYMTAGDDSTVRTEKDIYFVAIWGYGATGPIVAFADETIEGNQYDVIPVRYYVYDPTSETAGATLQIGDGTPRAITPGRTVQLYQYVTQDVGTVTMTLRSGSSVDTVTVTAAKSVYQIGIVTGDNLRYNLDPVGHSNSDVDRTSFGDMTFSSGFDWVNGGFQQDADGCAAFVVKKGHRATLPRSLFSDSDVNGKTIDISFRVVNSDEYGAVAMQDLDSTSTHGIILRANEGEVRYGTLNGQVCRYCEEQRIDMSIQVEEAVTQRVSLIWLDGIPSKADKYEEDMLVQSENPMVIGSDHCDVWVYAIRIYNSALSETDMIQNYIASGSTTEEKFARYEANMIRDTADKITPSSLHAVAPDLTIITIAAERMSVSKSDSVSAEITIRDGDTILVLSAAGGTVFKVQGTSSVAYARSALNMDIDFKKTGTKYKISENSIPVNYLNIKVNVASSENANNVCAVDWYNQFQPYLTEHRSTSGARDTVEGKPCAVFFTNTGSEAVWVSSQYVEPGETILYVMGDLCNSKKNTEVFGQKGTGTHPTKACIEVSGNDTDPQQFIGTAVYNKDRGQWDSESLDDEGNVKYIKHFEWRMEPSDDDLDEVVAAWDELVAWVVATKDNPGRFKAEFGNYFAQQSMLYHFLMLEFFAAYDNVSKNTFYSYDWDEDKQTYLWNIKCAYDWDTILAFDNDGLPFGDYGVDYGDAVGTHSYFNASLNPIWLNIQKAFHAELSALYISLRSAGAWNSSALIAKFDAYQAKRPHAAMVRDAYIKYIAPYQTTGVVIDGKTYGYDDNYIGRLNGSKTYQRRQFFTYQTDYMDGKYGYVSKSSGTQFRTNGASMTKDFTVKAYAKTYITMMADDNVVASKKVEAGSETVFENVSVGSNTTIYVTPDRLVQHIRPLNETDNSTFSAAGAAKLMEAILGGEAQNLVWPAGNTINLPSPILKSLSIRNMVNFSAALNLAANVELETLDTRGTNAGRITIAPYAPLTSIQLNAATGLVLPYLTKVETFTLESGANLTYLSMEGCNSLIRSSVLTYLQQAYAASPSLGRALRLIGVSWDLSDKTMLNLMLKARAIDANGRTGEAPCIISGSVHIPSCSRREKDAYDAAWPGVVQVETVESEFLISFYNADGTPILDASGNPYVQYIIQGDTPYDPALDGIPDPTMEMDEQYEYTFSGWNTLEAPALMDRRVTAVYDTAVRAYTVRVWDRRGGTVLLQRENVQYGSEIDLSDFIATYTADESSYIFNLFTGLDKSAGFIRSDLDIYCQWSRSVNYPEKGTDLSEMTPGQIYALTRYIYAGASASEREARAEEYLSMRDHFEFMTGRDYTFSNVKSVALVSTPLYLDGSTIVTPTVSTYDDGSAIGEKDLNIFSADSGNWTMAIDFEFVDQTSEATLATVGYDQDGSKGFRLRYSNGPDVQFGNVHAQVGVTSRRGIVVIRHLKGTKNIFVYANDVSAAEVYSDTILSLELARNTDPGSDEGIRFGGISASDGGVLYPARGWIHWCKLWMDDLGEGYASKMGNWPHESWRMEYYGTGLYYYAGGSSQTTAMSFIASNLLPKGHRHRSTNVNEGGWPKSELGPFLDSRALTAVPPWVRALIKQVAVYSSEGDKSTALVNAPGYIYLPAYRELTGSTGTPYGGEANGRIPWFVAGTDQSGNSYSENASRVKFRGQIIRKDAKIITSGSDPTALTGVTIEEGDIWINTNNSSIGYMYISYDTWTKHRFIGIDANGTNVIQAQEKGNATTHGKWIPASYWWGRSPYAASSASFMGVSSIGYAGYYNFASVTCALDPCFSF